MGMLGIAHRKAQRVAGAHKDSHHNSGGAANNYQPRLGRDDGPPLLRRTRNFGVLPKQRKIWATRTKDGRYSKLGLGPVRGFGGRLLPSGNHGRHPRVETILGPCQMVASPDQNPNSRYIFGRG